MDTFKISGGFIVKENGDLYNKTTKYNLNGRIYEINSTDRFNSFNADTCERIENLYFNNKGKIQSQIVKKNNDMIWQRFFDYKYDTILTSVVGNFPYEEFDTTINQSIINKFIIDKFDYEGLEFKTEFDTIGRTIRKSCQLGNKVLHNIEYIYDPRYLGPIKINTIQSTNNKSEYKKNEHWITYDKTGKLILEIILEDNHLQSLSNHKYTLW